MQTAPKPNSANSHEEGLVTKERQMPQVPSFPNSARLRLLLSSQKRRRSQRYLRDAPDCRAMHNN